MMFLSINRLSQYNKDGYICFDNIINKKNCPKIIKIVRNFQSKNKFNNKLDRNHPFSNISDNYDKVVILDQKNNDKLDKLIGEVFS